VEAASNTGSNPSDEQRTRAKAEHRLGWHVKGGWCRKFPGDTNRTYFGKIPVGEAVRLMNAEQERRARGIAAEVQLRNLLVREAVNRFLTHLDREHAAGKIGDVQRASYGDELVRFTRVVGKNRRLTDFCKLTAPEELFRPLRSVAVARGLIAAEKHVTQVRTFLDWCSSTRRFIAAPFYADAFDAPTEKEKRAVRKATRKAKGIAFWQPEGVREIVAAAKASDVHRYAQVLLMLNGGMGSTDLSNLEDEDVDWQRRCIHTDRSKTLVPRVVPLWPETIDAMQLSRAARRKPARGEWANRFFLTKHGRPLVQDRLTADRTKTRRTDSVKNWFYALFNGKARKRWKAQAVRLPHLKRHGAGAYTLRSVFTTLSLGHGGDKNLEAVILGQQFDRPILEFYIRDEQREKLVGVVDHVRRQLWPDLI
jgi:integrase